MLPDQTEIAELIRVAIVEDHKSLREGMEWMLGSSAGYVCIGAYGSCEEALDFWARRPLQAGDVVLMDVGLPGMSGTQGAGLVKKHYPEAQVIMLTMREETDIILEAIQSGAVGYLLKSTPPNEILQAIQTVVEGGSSLSGPVAMRILEQFKPDNNPNIKEFNLSEREMQILQGLVDGLTYKMLAEALFISIDTVRSHIKKLYEKLHVHSRNEAVAVAVNRGIRPDPK